MKVYNEIAIIGVGPKGLYCFERLLAEIKANDMKRPIRIHLINKQDCFGSSLVYDTSQPPYILLNVSVGEINTWSSPSPPPVVNISLDFVSWYNNKFNPGKNIDGTEYLGRSFVGQYLNECFHQLCVNAPANVQIIKYVGEATNIIISDKDHNDNKYTVKIAIDKTENRDILVDKILLATGHSIPALSEFSRRMWVFSQQSTRASFIPFVYPVLKKLKKVGANDKVAMMGIGLTFIDALLELTEGRGGCFQKSKNNKLVYFPSGNEPSIIYPFCRSGLPIIPKSDILPSDLKPLTFCTSENLQRIKKTACDQNRKIDFKSDLLPLIEAEMQRAYFEVLMTEVIWKEKLLACRDNLDEMNMLIQEFLELHPKHKSFDLLKVIYPSLDMVFENGLEYNTFIIKYLENEISRAKKGQSLCPVKAATEIWFEVRYALNEVTAFGGLTPESHKYLIEEYYPLLKRVVFGPPSINIQKVLALLQSGILNFSLAINPKILTSEVSGLYELTCDKTGGESHSVDTIIDCRFPANSIGGDQSKLSNNLSRSGLIRVFQNKAFSDINHGYEFGAIDMTVGTQNVISKNGDINNDISVIGIPTELNIVGNLNLAVGKFPGEWANRIVTEMVDNENI